MHTRMSLALSVAVAASIAAAPVAVAQSAPVATVHVVDNAFDPATVEIDAGDTVEWAVAENVAEPHTVTHRDEPQLFNSGDLDGGARFSQRFDTPGIYRYWCLNHPDEMTGEVLVTGVTQEGPPGAPTSVSATAGNQSAMVTWSPPSSDGGSPITDYTVTALPGGATAEVSGNATTATVAGLTNGTAYTFTVNATNAVGTGPPSAASAPVTPTDDPGPDLADCPPAAFTDRSAISATHRGNVDCAAELGLVSGFADGTFGPTRRVRRDQMASFIARTLENAGVPLPAPRAERFGDVAPGSAHDEAIHRLAAAGIVQGGAGGGAGTSYGASLGVRRDQMASFLVRAASYAVGQDLASSDQRFTDVPASNPHFENVNGAAQAGLAQGFPDGTYGPGAGVRRDQMGTFVMRLFDFVDG